MNATSVALDRSGVVATLRIAGDVTSASEPDLMAGYARAIDDGGSHAASPSTISMKSESRVIRKISW